MVVVIGQVTKMLMKILIFSVVVALSSAEKVRYDNYALYKVQPESEEELQYIKKLQEDNDDLDFWKEVEVVGDYASVVAPPHVREEFEHSLSKRSIRSDLMLENIQEAFDAQLYSRRKRDTDSRSLFWTNYQTISDIYAWFYELAENYRDIVTVITIGQTYEGRNITGIRISRGMSRRNFVLEGGQIGADWLSPTVLTYIVDQLVRGEDPEARAASQNFAWHIFPILNPDGHQYSQDAERLWVKNRRPVTFNSVGVDLTRNWNSQWGIIGASFTPSANNYAGIGPFSEVETRSLSEYVESLAPELTGFLSFRSFGQRLLVPFAHSTAPMYNYNEMITIGRRAMGSLAVRYNTQYLVGTSAAVYDGATGVVADWIKYRYNPPIVATYHLRDTGNWGYTLPANQVEPSCLETYDSLMALLREAQFINVV